MNVQTQTIRAVKTSLKYLEEENISEIVLEPIYRLLKEIERNETK